MRFKLALIALAIAVAIAPLPASVIERYYSSTIFPWLQLVVTALSNQLSMAFLDALIVLAAIWLIGLTLGAFLLRHRVGWFAAAGRWTVNVAASAAIVYLA